MRILMMIASMAESGGIEMLVRNLAVAYAHKGHACHIVYISDAGSLGASAEYEHAFMTQMDAAGVGYSMLGHECRRVLPLGALRLRHIVATFKPDIVHVHLPFGLLFQAIGMCRVPTIYTHHNTVVKFPPWLFRVFDRFVNHYIAICRACEDLLRSHVARPIALIYNGVPDTFALGGQRSAPTTNPIVLCVGNLTTQKNYSGLVSIAGMLVTRFARHGGSIRFQIAGEGPERPRIEAAIAGAGLNGSVELLGARRDVSAIMAKADMMLNCSDYEGLPIALIEAARSGLPIVATAVGGTPEIVANGINGSLVPRGDLQAAALAIETLLRDVSRYQRYSAATLERSAVFNMAECVESHLRLYVDVAQR